MLPNLDDTSQTVPGYMVRNPYAFWLLSSWATPVH